MRYHVTCWDLEKGIWLIFFKQKQVIEDLKVALLRNFNCCSSSIIFVMNFFILSNFFYFFFYSYLPLIKNFLHTLVVISKLITWSLVIIRNRNWQKFIVMVSFLVFLLFFYHSPLNFSSTIDKRIDGNMCIFRT